jgi:hypothetical protein
MAGKEDEPSSSSGPSKTEEKPLDKGKGKAIDPEEKKEPKRDEDGKIIEDAKVLPPGTAKPCPPETATG